MIKIDHVAYVSMRLDERDLVTPFPRLKLYFPKVTKQRACIRDQTANYEIIRKIHQRRSKFSAEQRSFQGRHAPVEEGWKGMN